MDVIELKEKFPKFIFEDSTGSNMINFGDIKSARGSLKVIGESNTVNISNSVLINSNIRVQGNNNTLIIHENAAIRGQILIKGNNQKVVIGENTTFQSVYLLCQESCDITIGANCMFSRDIEVRTTDAHSVIDIDTNKRINKPGSIFIDDHVWVSLRVIINKGVSIASDNVVGAGAFLNGNYSESNTVIAGCPAKVVKKGVTWNRGRKTTFTDSEINSWK